MMSWLGRRLRGHLPAGCNLLAALTLTAGLAATGCLSEAERGIAQPFCPPYEPVDDFRLVNNMLERRCGTLDCHGQKSRPFIVFGQNAYRRPGAESSDTPPIDPDEYFPGGQEATLEYELRGTYDSMCGLEPEKMDRVVKGENPNILSLVRKPRLEEKHKGGRIWGTGTREGDACLISWLQSESADTPDRQGINKEACLKELEDP